MSIGIRATNRKQKIILALIFIIMLYVLGIVKQAAILHDLQQMRNEVLLHGDAELISDYNQTVDSWYRMNESPVYGWLILNTWEDLHINQ